MSVKLSVRTYILENFMFSDDQALLCDTDSFLEEGIVDSTGVLELVMFVEEAFNISVKDQEIVPENFDSVKGLVHYVQQKTKETIPDASQPIFAG